MGEVVGIEDNRFAPAEAKEQEHQGADGVEMGQRIKSQSALGTRSGVAETVGQEGVGKFVDGNGDDETKKKIECFHQWLKYSLVNYLFLKPKISSHILWGLSSHQAMISLRSLSANMGRIINDWQDNFERDKIATYDKEEIWLCLLRQGHSEQQSGQLFQESGKYHSPTKPASPPDGHRR